MTDLIPAPAQARVPVRGGATFPVRRIYCVGRNFADHAREMGAAVPASKADRGQPVFFLKPADAVVTHGADIPYPPGTQDLHHEVELVVAIGGDAPAGVLSLAEAPSLVIAYGVGLDRLAVTCRVRPRPRACPGTLARASIIPRQSANWCRRPTWKRWKPAASACR